MKILFIHNKYQQYGGEDVVLEMETSILSKNGHDVRTILFDNSSIKNFVSKIRSAINSVYNFSSANKVVAAIKDFKPDIIHIHNLFFIASPSILYVAKKYNTPVVLTLHNYRLICANALLLRNGQVCELCVHKKLPLAGIRYKCYRNSMIESSLTTAISGIHKLSGTWKNKVAAFITSNEFSRSKFLTSSLNIPAEKMITKSNFVPDPGEGDQQREDFFLFAGRIAKEKGVDVLLKAFATLPGQKIVVIGDGPEKKNLEQDFKNFPNISFKGHLEKQQVLEFMKKCKAFICPSIWYEPGPLTILESFATGTPVIASGLGPMAETVSNAYNGLHFTPGDPKDLNEKIKIFIKETETSKMFYQNARQTYLRKYHPDIHYKAILEIYKKILTENENKA